MNDLPRIGHLGGEPTAAKVHEVVQIDGDVLLGGDAQDPVGAVVPAVGGVEDARRLEVHEQKGLCAAGELLGRNDAQNLGLYGIGTHHHALVDGLDDSLGKRVLKPLGRVRVVEVRRRVVDDAVHVSVMNGEQEVPPLAVTSSIMANLGTWAFRRRQVERRRPKGIGEDDLALCDTYGR